jgi:hypothetical protein
LKKVLYFDLSISLVCFEAEKTSPKKSSEKSVKDIIIFLIHLA